jgi:hypothetical protein
MVSVDTGERGDRGGGGKGCAIAVFYEDMESRNWALRALEHLLPQMDVESSWWGFHYLRDAAISHEASTAASEADVILVVVSSQQRVSGEVKAWFERCLTRGVPFGAGLGLIERQKRGPYAPELDYFQRFAQRAGLDYHRFGQEEAEMEKRVHGYPWVERLDDRFHSSGWGLNE